MLSREQHIKLVHMLADFERLGHEVHNGKGNPLQFRRFQTTSELGSAQARQGRLVCRAVSLEKSARERERHRELLQRAHVTVINTWPGGILEQPSVVHQLELHQNFAIAPSARSIPGQLDDRAILLHRSFRPPRTQRTFPRHAGGHFFEPGRRQSFELAAQLWSRRGKRSLAIPGLPVGNQLAHGQQEVELV